MSTKEVIIQRDQHSGEQLSFNDVDLARNQEAKRMANHRSSARSKAKGVPFATYGRMEVGDLVCIKRKKSKGKARDLITKIEGDYAILKKLTKEKFMSKRYKVLLSEIYSAVPNQKTTQYYEWDTCCICK